MFAKLLCDAKICTTHLRTTKRSEIYSINKPIFRIQFDTVHVFGALQLVDTSAFFSKGLFAGGQFFYRRGINLNAQRKSVCIPRVLVGPPLELVHSTSSADCCCIFDDLVQMKRRGVQIGNRRPGPLLILAQNLVQRAKR